MVAVFQRGISGLDLMAIQKKGHNAHHVSIEIVMNGWLVLILVELTALILNNGISDVPTRLMYATGVAIN